MHKEEQKESEEIKRLRHENEVLRKMQQSSSLVPTRVEEVVVKREPPLVSEQEIKEHITNVKSMKNNVDTIAA